MTEPTITFKSFHLPSIVDSLNQGTDILQKQKNFPPINLYFLGENRVVLEVAISGYSKDEISLKTMVNSNGVRCLYVYGAKSKEEDDEDIKYLHKEIATRNFSVAIPIEYSGKTLKVNEERVAITDTNVLRVEMDVYIPEEYKEKLITIN